MNVSVSSITIGENSNINIILSENDTTNVTVIVKNKKDTTSIINGTASITVTGLFENTTALFSYTGD